MKPTPALRSFLLASSLLTPATVQAQTWTGATNELWTTAGNWNDGTPNPATNGTSTVTFYNTGAGNLSTTTNSFYNLNSVTFNSTATSPVTIGVTRTSLDLTTTSGTTIRFNGASTSSHTFDIANLGFDNRVAVGSLGREAYFTSGSLNVVVIPEPRAALLGGIGLLMLLRRRRG